MKIFLDSEFYENGKTIEPISIGLVREDGAEYYAEFSDFSWLYEDFRGNSNTYDWLCRNVRPYLTGMHYKTRQEVAREIVEFVGDWPDFWAYYADYDWVLLCQLYGSMIDLPAGWPMFCNDLKQLTVQLGNPRLSSGGTKHNALSDARWVRDQYDFLSRLLADTHEE